MHHIPPPVIYTADIGALAAFFVSALGGFPSVVTVTVGILAGVVYGLQIWDRVSGRNCKGKEK